MNTNATPPERPVALEVIPESIPAEMQRERRWVVWRYMLRADLRTGERKWTKPPYQAGRPQSPASSTDPATWGTYAQALAAYQHGDAVGIGFMLGDGWAAVDLDHVVDAATGEIVEWARVEIEGLGSYAELSPSGEGVHGVLHGRVPDGDGHKRGGIEAYSARRFITVTGHQIPGAAASVEARQEALNAFVARRFPPKAGPSPDRQDAPGEPLALDDEALLEKALAAGDGGKFAALWRGELAGYPSPSEAVAALLCKLAFWTRKDEDRMDCLFRRSGLMSEKWESRRGDTTWGALEIARAIALTSDVYTPARPARERDQQNGHETGSAHAESQAGQQQNSTSSNKGTSGNQAEDPWDEPTPLPGGLLPVPKLTPERVHQMLPAALAPWVLDEAERMQAPVEFVAVAAIALAGALVGRRLAIAPKARDPWHVIANQWAALVGPPSSLKTPAARAAVSDVLRQLEYAAERAYQKALVAWTQAHADWEAERGAIEKLLRQRTEELLKLEGDTGKDVSKQRERLTAQVAALKARRDALVEPERPTERRYQTQDATTEKIIELLATNPFGLLVWRDELYGWLRSLDKEGRETDRPFYLEASDGLQSYRQDRIVRGEKRASGLCLSILGSIQPGRVQRYLREAAEGGIADDGLMQRFGLLVWPDPLPDFDYVDRTPDADAHDRAAKVFAWLARLTPESVGAAALSEEEMALGRIPLLRFSREAQPLFEEWYTALMRRLRIGSGTGELTPALESHLGKYPKLVPGLALLFHLIDVGDDQASPEGGVGRIAFLRAAAWAEFLEPHARRAYTAVLPESMERARDLLKRLRADPTLHRQTIRELGRHQWHNLTTIEDMEAAVGTLVQYGWVRVVEVETAGRSRKEVHLHPSLLHQGEGGKDGNE